MPTLSDFLARGVSASAHHPWPRVAISATTWREANGALASGALTLVSIWGDGETVHMAVSEADSFAILSLACPDGKFPSVGRLHAPAIRLERTIADLYGLVPEDADDRRPWLDHGRWGITHPLGGVAPTPADPPRYEFLPVEGESLHQIPVGPVHAGIIEPGHFRFTANGETVVRLEERLGYVHKGIDGLMRGADVAQAAKLAGRNSGDSTVAYSIAFARAVETALRAAVPPRGEWLRALMAELERLANHFGDIGAICNDATFVMMHAQCGILRERVLRAADACFGHRLMMDRVVPGGVAADLPSEGVAHLRALLAEVGTAFPKLVELYDNTASLQDRTVSTGTLTQALALEFGAGGYVGRASGRAFDARRTPSYPPYDALDFEVPVLEAGDVDARVWIRIKEVGESLSLIRQILEKLPAGPVAADLRAGAGHAVEGAALIEGFRGDIFVWLRLGADGRVERCHLRDPSWFQWPLLEAVIEGNIVADFPLCNKSFNCSYSGHDL
jgi:Ni,Fe-hydrogenase III large subunit